MKCAACRREKVASNESARCLFSLIENNAVSYTLQLVYLLVVFIFLMSYDKEKIKLKGTDNEWRNFLKKYAGKPSGLAAAFDFSLFIIDKYVLDLN